MKRIFGVLCIALFVQSCTLIGINIKHKTPKRAKKLPHFEREDSLIGTLSKERSCYDVHYYDLDVAFFNEKKLISGQVTIHYTVVEDFKRMQIDLQDNFDFEIQYPAKYIATREHRAIFIDFEKEHKRGTSDSIVINYWGKPDKAKRPPWKGGFVYKKDDNKNPWMGVACEQIGASIWWPVKDHLSDEPDSMMVNYFVPEGMYCVSNGSLNKELKGVLPAKYGIQELKGFEDTKRDYFQWKITYPINSYNVTFYIGDFKKFSLPYKDTKQLDFYVLPESLDTAKVHFQQTEEIMSFFEEVFGEYPYWRDGYKLVESPYEGMEHQTAIAYGSGFKNERGYDHDYIILHETAHEWWGNSITVNDYADIWLHEGFATYAEALFVERKYGYSKYLDYLDFYAMLIKNKKSVVGPKDVNYWNFHDGDPYMKGALTLHTLRNTINDDPLFFDIIKSFYAKYKYKNVTTQNFIDLVNEKTKTDLSWFFEQYLFKRECPTLLVYMAFNPLTQGLDYHYKWKNNLDLPIPILFNNGTKDTLLYPSNEVQVLEDKGTFPWFNVKGSYIRIEYQKKPIY